MRVNGGPALADSEQFLWDLVAALKKTLEDDAKFERFARKVLGDGHSASAAQELRAEVTERTGYLDNRNQRDKSDTPGGKYGYARLDAFGGIFNQVLAANLNLPQNYRPGNAPVSYPFLWDSSQEDLVQWNGLLPNAGPGPLIRNVGEILGVFGEIDVDPNHPHGYKSSVNVKGLGEPRDLDRRPMVPAVAGGSPARPRPGEGSARPEPLSGELPELPPADRPHRPQARARRRHEVAPGGGHGSEDGDQRLEPHRGDRPATGAEDAVPARARHAGDGAGSGPPREHGDRHDRGAPGRGGQGRDRGVRQGQARVQPQYAQLQGALAQRHLGHRALPAQRLGAEPLGPPAAGGAAAEDVLRRQPGDRPGQRRPGRRKLSRSLPARHHRARQLELPATPARSTARS